MKKWIALVAAMAVVGLAGCALSPVDPFEDPGDATDVWPAGAGDNEVNASIASSGLPPESEGFFEGGPIVFEVRGIVEPETLGVYDPNMPIVVNRSVGLAAKWFTLWSVSIYGVEVSSWLLEVNGEAPQGMLSLQGREWSSFQLEYDEHERPTVIDWVDEEAGGYDVAEFGLYEVWSDSTTTVPNCEFFPNPHEAHGQMWLWTPFQRIIDSAPPVVAESIVVPMKYLNGAWRAFVAFPDGVMRVVPYDDWSWVYLVGLHARPIGVHRSQELWYATENPELYGDWTFLRALCSSDGVIVPEDPNTCGLVN